MIEVIIDGNDNDEFLQEKRPVFDVSSFSAATWKEYRQYAHDFFMTYSDHRIVIVRNSSDNFSNNWFAVALFVESCLIDSKIDAVIFKVKDKSKALKEYAPYVALTIGIKFIINLSQESTACIYKEFGNLGYLGLNIKQDYFADKIYLKLERAKAPLMLVSHDLEQALEIIGFLKAEALSDSDYSFNAEINITKETNSVNVENVIDNIIKKITPILANNS